MTDLPVLRLRKNEDRRIRAGHLWIFSNEIDTSSTPLTAIEPGEIVDVHDARGGFLGRGYANPRSLIAVRLLSRRRRPIDRDLLASRITRALELREQRFPEAPFYRLIYGEADGIPGLVADRFGETLVVQPTTAGVERLLPELVPLLSEIVGVPNLLIRADSPSRQLEGLEAYVRVALGSVPGSVEIVENGARFLVPVLEGQKTGWFFDHRMNRRTLGSYTDGRSVLDVFSYVGGWGVQAAVAGAREVHCVDSSSVALDGVASNAELNGVAGRVRVRQGDAFEVLQQLRGDGARFDIVVLDPPAFIKRKKDLREGEQAYRRLNRLGFELLSEGGILVSASCSYHLGRDSLLRAVLWGATKAGRESQIVEEGHQGPDHPVHPAIPETSYLKAFFVRALD